MKKTALRFAAVAAFAFSFAGIASAQTNCKQEQRTLNQQENNVSKQIGQ
jgi:hypothetical protein